MKVQIVRKETIDSETQKVSAIVHWRAEEIKVSWTEDVNEIGAASEAVNIVKEALEQELQERRDFLQKQLDELDNDFDQEVQELIMSAEED